MEHDVELIARSTDEGGFIASFNRQLSALGGTASLVSEMPPFRVETSNGFLFETRRTYHIVWNGATDEGV